MQDDDIYGQPKSHGRTLIAAQNNDGQEGRHERTVQH